MKPSKSLIKARKKWLGKNVIFSRRDRSGRKINIFHLGVVKGLSDNQAEMEANAREIFNETGLLIECSELGQNSTYGDYPIRFEDAEIIDK
jgi:hypothetical protein